MNIILKAYIVVFRKPEILVIQPPTVGLIQCDQIGYILTEVRITGALIGLLKAYYFKKVALAHWGKMKISLSL